MAKVTIDTLNRQFVGGQAGRIVVQIPARSMTPEQALIHAAWLVALAEPGAMFTFEDALAAVKAT